MSKEGARPTNYNLRSAGPVDSDTSDSEDEGANMNHNNNIQLEPFKGQGEDPEKWFLYFERYCQYHNLNADRAALAMPFHLKGVAKIWFDSLQAGTQASLRLLREAFIARFKSTNNVDISVLSLTQNTDETVEEYFSRFIDNVSGKDLPENIQISIMTKGLLPQLVTLVMPQNPQTLEDLRQAMVLAEQTQKATQPKPAVASVDQTLTEEIRCLRNQLSEVLAISGPRQPQQPQPTYQNYRPNNYNQGQGRQTYQGPQREYHAPQQQQDSWKCSFCGGKRYHIRSNCPASNQICRYCNKKGHFMRECRAARRSSNRV